MGVVFIQVHPDVQLHMTSIYTRCGMMVNKWNGLKQETVSANNIESFKKAQDHARRDHETKQKSIYCSQMLNCLSTP